MRTRKGGVTGLPAKRAPRTTVRGREARQLLTRKNKNLPRVNAPRVPVVLARRQGDTAAAPEPIAALPPPAAPPLTDEEHAEMLKTVIGIVESTEIPAPKILNPGSKFVLATYWWGRGSLNPDTKRPCTSYEADSKEDPVDALEGAMDSLTLSIDERRDANVKDLAAASESSAPDIRKRLYDERPAKKNDEIIARFRQMCTNTKTNFITVEYPFEPRMHSVAPQAKAVFIQKVLDSVKDKGLSVVYVDPEVRVNKYPAIFDMENVDFMSRGLRFDSRSAREGDCFDPYVFETSRVFYFADTVGARDLLNTWRLSIDQNPTKSCEYILSMAFNVLKYSCALSYVQLPIEYMWLTDLLLFRKGASNAILENADCINSGDPVLPEHYDHLIDEVVKCDRRGGKFYEYVFFPKKDMTTGFRPFLDHLGADVVPFDSKYGDRQAIADKNIEDAKTAEGAPADFNVPKILAELAKGNDVTIGDDPRLVELKTQPLDFIAFNKNTKTEHPVHPDMMPEFDTSKSMFFSAKNPVVYHLLAMCENANDLTTIFNSSFVFVSRIRCYWLR